MDRALNPTDTPAHLLMTGAVAVNSANAFGLTPDHWVAVASIATAVGVGASILMYFFRVWMALREDSRRERESRQRASQKSNGL